MTLKTCGKRLVECLKGNGHLRKSFGALTALQNNVVGLVPSGYADGVYVLTYGTKPSYIGSTTNIYRRIGQHIDEDSKTFDNVWFLPTTGFKPERRLLLEDALIAALRPQFNLKGESFKVDKATIGELYYSDAWE